MKRLSCLGAELKERKFRRSVLSSPNYEMGLHQIVLPGHASNASIGPAKYSAIISYAKKTLTLYLG